MGHGAGTSVANPLEIPIGPASPTELLVEALEPVLGGDGQAFGDVLVHVNVAAYYNYGTAGLVPLVAALEALAGRQFPARFAVVARNLDVAAPSDAELLQAFVRESGVRVHRDFDTAARAIAAAQRFDAARVQ